MKKLTLLLLCLVLLFSISFSKTVTLNYLEVMTSPERTKLLKDMISKYEKENPDIKINLISPPYEQADQKATLMLNTNQKLDIVEIRDYTLKQFVNNGKLEDLSKYFENWKDAEDLTAVAKKAAYTLDNKPYLVPQCIFIKALFVREDVLKQNGINTLPKTIDELIDIAIKITDPSKNQYGFTWRGKSSEFKYSDLFASAEVENIKNEKYIYSTEKEFFNTEDYKRGMEKYIKLFKEAVPKDGVNWGFNEQINSFVSGMTPFLIQDSDAIPLINNLMDENKYTVIPIPEGPHGYTYLDYGFTGVGIPSYSKNKTEAWNFIKWLNSPEQNGYFNEHYGALPVHKSTYENNEHFKNEKYAAYGKEMVSEKYIFKTYPLDSERWPGWSQIHEVDMQNLLLGNTELKRVLKKWEAYWN
ncbi:MULTISPECIES: ABC transporter substrate-binding protein [Oceanotoga]|uniref:Carbohydrate ABC transporter substrate-binding protein (CUT1 family) n=1 Tax=Oceanotoga teriensis TaxID=515440 RepID=A0AA45C728_9BACT|nr:MULTISPECIES: sugar ABC transporter substrate-binding protein [Oceanotoga]MDN5341449.1 multiple sugar transport system substrate-binding protein [Oceanotoga sp.]MDO7975919.1 sugar ABC transporter substrate-binding protein [Oceanotoga teriensis]PWJ95097.1 carbohydrate ABC transporter substrate-binding protein (CUT1 family) [Oceanotoga teriensis]